MLGENKHEPPYNFILKKVLGSTFETNLACYHGKKFEQVVTMMYEYKNDVHTEEFGLLGHPDHYFLGASPDGICSPYHRDMKTRHELVGRMLEIKCPLMRKIKYSGDIKDTICPIYYWCQVQLQLECCDLDECDFIQCNIEEYKTREEWLEDTSPDCEFKTKKYGLERGIVIELLPAKLTEDDYLANGVIKDTTVYNVASFLYPPKIDMSLKELDDWVLSELSNLQVNKPNLKLHRVIYWRLIENNCTLILRDRKWFESNLNKLRTMWGYVEYLRANLDVMDQWKTWMDGLPKKFNDKVMDKLIELIDKKKKSLDPNYVESEPKNEITIETGPDAKPPQISIKKSNKNKESNDILIGEEKTNNKKEIKPDGKLDTKQELEEKPVQVKKTRQPKEPKEPKESKEVKKTVNKSTKNVASKVPDPIVESCVETVIIQEKSVVQQNQIPNVQLDSEDSDSDIVLPDIKRPVRAKKK